MSASRERPRVTRRWVRDEVVIRRCPACEIRTTHVLGDCQRCARLRETRRRGLYLTLGGALLLAAGIPLIVTAKSDPSPGIAGAILVLLGACAVYPGLYGLLYRRWPELDDRDL